MIYGDFKRGSPTLSILCLEVIRIKFKNIDEIQKYYQKQLNAGNKSVLSDIKTKDGKNYGQITDEILIVEAEELRKCIQARIDEYYNSYSPKYYTRSKDLGRHGLHDALKVETSVTNEGGKKCIGLYFEDSWSWGRSVVTGEWNGYKPYLISDGFKNKSLKTPHFDGYEGFHFIEKGIEDWKSNLKYAIEIKRIGTTGKYDMAKAFGYTFE